MSAPSKLFALSSVAASEVHAILQRSMLKDGHPVVVDLDRSLGSYLVDKLTGTRYLDFFTYFATQPLGHNHPAIVEPAFVAQLGRIATTKPSNSDLYTEEMADFVDTLFRTAQPAELPHAFFVDGGALAVENALKAAFDWKFQKRAQRGLPDDEQLSVIHFREAFHGRSGYTMSLTNTDPTKVRWYPKFDWPRIPNPKIQFPLADHQTEVETAEAEAIAAIERALAADRDRIAALIIEPIQGEGGDNHFRGEFLSHLRRLCDENEMLFIVDEVQTGVGTTGRWWAYQHFGFLPDLLAFGKKMQICGILAGRRLDDVDSVFKHPSRINSTWGGNLVDMVRATRYLQVIENENLVENAAKMGDYFVQRLGDLAARRPGQLTNVRGRGLFVALTLESPARRDALLHALFDERVLALKSGASSIRFRPPLTVSHGEIDEAVSALDRILR